MLKEALALNELSLSEAANVVGYDKSTLSKIINGDYPHAQDRELEICSRLKKAGYEIPQTSSVKRMRVDRTAFVPTANVEKFHKLADGLLDPSGLLNSSLGVVIGTAGRGKTFTCQRYAALYKDSAYVLFVDGYSPVKLLKEIAYELSGARPGQFEKCLNVIEEASRINRKLVIIDEADKMPIKYHEMLRGINERCQLPLLLVGEEELYSKLANVPRLRSRIRKPIVKFNPVDIVDISTFYKLAVHLTISPEVSKVLCVRSSGDFRVVVNEANEICDIMNTNNLSTIDLELLEQI